MAMPNTQEKINKLAGQLECRGISTLDDLRMCIGQDIETGIRWLAVSTRASQALLLALLIADATDEAARKGTRKLFRYWPSLEKLPAILSLPRRLWHDWKNHWPDAVALALVAMLVAAVVLRVRTIDKGDVQFVAVKRGINLPVFHQLGDNDLEMKSTPGDRGPFTRFEQVRDRYTLAAISANAVLQANQLLSTPLSQKMRGRRILTVALKPTAYSTTLSVPAETGMILSPRDPKAPTVQPMTVDVIVLRIDTIGEGRSATIALPEDKLALVAPLLASHDVFLSEIIP